MLPLFFMTICKHFGIESLKYLKYSVDISWHHTFFSSSSRILRLSVFFLNIFFFILCVQFSIGFKSGLLPGYSRTLICFCSRYLIIFLALWQGALPRLAGRVQCSSFCVWGESTGLPCLFPQKNIPKPLPTADV